jgi:hypothetical protein
MLGCIKEKTLTKFLVIDLTPPPALHSTWDVNNDGANDCEDEGICDHTLLDNIQIVLINRATNIGAIIFKFNLFILVIETFA